MKNKLGIILGILMVLLLPKNADALSATFSISCNGNTVGQTTTCTITGKSDGEVSAVDGNIQISGPASFVSFQNGSGWSGTGDVRGFKLYTDVNKNGTFTVGTVTLANNSAGSVTLIVNGLVIYGGVTDNFDEHSCGSTSKSYTAVVPTQQTQSTQPQVTPTQPTNTTKRPVSPTSPVNTTQPQVNPTAPVLSPLKLLSVTVEGFNVRYENGIYYATTEYYTEKVNVTATAEEGVSIIGTGVRSLSYGRNVVQLVLRNNSGQTNTYQLIITRPDDTDNHDTNLTNLKIVDYPFAFDPSTKEYTVTIPYNVNEVYVIAETLNDDVHISGAGLKVLQKGKNTLYVKVSYGEHVSTDYVIHIKRSYGFMIVLIISIALGGGVIGALFLAYINKKAYKEALQSAKNKEVADSYKEAIPIAQSFQVNGANAVGEGAKTVIPKKVISVKTPVQTINTNPQVPVDTTPMSNNSPDAQVKLAEQVMPDRPSNEPVNTLVLESKE